MRDLIEIKNFIADHEGEDLVICTLVRKSGSSYRSVGSKKIISLDGTSCGLLSGGCLENAIEMAARNYFAELPFIESFSTLSEEDRLFGYQTGCKGVIEILFEKLDPSKVDSYLPFGPKATAWGVRVGLAGDSLGVREFLDSPVHPRSADFFVEPWVFPLHLVLIGCGADADAYLPLARSLGWSIEFVDYRGDFAYAERFPGEKIRHLRLPQIGENIPQGRQVAVVLMTHNYEADLQILRDLKNHRLGYLGCLGPYKRYERLQSDLKNLYQEELSPQLKGVVSAPIGLFTHSSSPEAIALSVVAQIQEKLVEANAANTWTMILAAGASKRFGGAKALAEWKGQTLLARALQTAKEFSGPATLVVTGGHAEQIQSHLNEVQSIHNESWFEGMGTSIAKGIANIQERDPNVEYVVILPVDQPMVESAHLQNLLDESRKTGRCVLTAGAEALGPPAVIPRKFFGRAQGLRGDRGLKAVLRAADFAAIEGGFAALDFDTPQELAMQSGY
jgi:xanthine dehydrogenase accessory factor